MKQATSQLNLLQGNLYRTIIKLGYPMALASAIQMLYNLADTFWLGKLGRNALAAPVISFHIVFFIISFGIGFSVTATSLVSQYIGAKKKDSANKTAGNILFYNFLVSVFFAAIALLFAEDFLTLLGTPAKTFQLTLDYLRIILWGIPIAFPFFVFQSTMNGYGDTKSPLKIEIISVGINLLIDPVLIFGWFGFPALGVTGAALATIFARGLSSAIGLYWFFSGKKGIKLRLKDLVPDSRLLPLIFRVGIPSSLGMSGTSLGFIVLLGIVNNFGTAVISAYGIGSRVIHIFMMPSMGISHAVTAITGQNIGAEKQKRAREAVKKGINLIMLVLIPPILLTMLFGLEIVTFFIPGDPLVQKIGFSMFLIITPSVLFLGLTNVLSGAFNGSGYTIPVMITNLSRIWLFRIPAVYLLSLVLLIGVQGIWWGMLISNSLSFLMIMVWYRNKDWTKGRIQ